MQDACMFYLHLGGSAPRTATYAMSFGASFLFWSIRAMPLHHSDPNIPTKRAGQLRSESGQSLIELALTLPMLLLLVLGVIDLGMGFRTYIALSNAAREGVRWVTVHPADVTGALDRVGDEAARINLALGEFGSDGYAISISPAKTAYAAGDRVTVTVHYDYELLFGTVTGLPSVPFNATATMVVLYNPPGP